MGGLLGATSNRAVQRNFIRPFPHHRQGPDYRGIFALLWLTSLQDWFVWPLTLVSCCNLSSNFRVLQRLTVPLATLAHCALIGFRQNCFLLRRLIQAGCERLLACLLAQGEVCIGALPLIASLEPSALQEPYAFKFP